jgi:hypothetical protein
MTDERLNAILAEHGWDHSPGVFATARLVADEASKEGRAAQAAAVANLIRQRDVYKAADQAMQEQCASLRLRLDDVRTAAIERLKTSPADGYRPTHGGRPGVPVSFAMNVNGSMLRIEPAPASGALQWDEADAPKHRPVVADPSPEDLRRLAEELHALRDDPAARVYCSEELWDSARFLRLFALRLERRFLSLPPIDMVLFCPSCGTQHIDAPDPQKNWDNRPHRSHACQNPACGHQWRPADVDTNGVRAIKTRGDSDSPGIAPLRVVRDKHGVPFRVRHASEEIRPDTVVSLEFRRET